LTIFFSAHESGTCFTHTAIFIAGMLLTSSAFVKRGRRPKTLN